MREPGRTCRLLISLCCIYGQPGNRSLTEETKNSLHYMHTTRHRPKHFAQSPKAYSKRKGHSMQQSITNTPAFTKTNAEKVSQVFLEISRSLPRSSSCALSSYALLERGKKPSVCHCHLMVALKFSDQFCTEFASRMHQLITQNNIMLMGEYQRSVLTPSLYHAQFLWILGKKTTEA